MPSRRPIGFAAAVLVAFSSFAVNQARAAVPTLMSAVSRITQGSIVHDVPLPLTGGSGIECRNITGGVQIVLTFDTPVNAGTAAITAGTAALNGAPTFSNYTMTVPIKGLIDAEAVMLGVSNVVSSVNPTDILTSASVPFRTLYGDLNGDGAVTISDLALSRAAVSVGVMDNGNFRSDVNADGALTISDLSLERAAVSAGATVAGGATNNTPPTISQIANQTVVTGAPMSPIGFTVADNESDPSLLAVNATSSDLLTIPNSSISVTGTGASRTITLTPAVGVTAVTPVTITMYVSDGLAYSTAMTFIVNVTPPPISYLATDAAISGTNSLGSGTGLLIVSGDSTYAIIKYSYSNLSSNDTDDAIYDSTGAVLYDIPVGRARGDLQPDGSLKWTFGANKAAALQAIQTNTAYILLESATFPAGELKGTFKVLTGSQNFVPPGPPPNFTLNPPSKADASRFLQQAAFGGTIAEVNALSNTAASNASTAINDWLTAQFKQPLPIYPDYTYNSVAPTSQPTTQSTMAPYTQPYSPSSMYAQIYNRVVYAQSPNVYGDSLADDRVLESWWKNAVTAPDSLRQRVATALSEIFVVSDGDGTIDENPAGLASYYDMLADDSFGNFRTLMGDVTLHPIMGHYLNMLGNNKTLPNENYAREIMQLFTIGLYMLNPDGSLQLDTTGAPIPTYSQPLVTSFAAVYTGWSTPTTRPVIPTLIAPVAPSTQPTVANVTSTYQQVMALTPTNHSSVAKTLLTYPGAKTYGAATQPAYIPAQTVTQTSNTANAELNFALDNIFNHPNVGPFVCKQLIQRLVESNPSPAYIYRVAQVFNNDGTGVRGNMKAVITAILTDYEARSPAVQSNAGYGHMREPMIRIAQILHSLNAVSKSGKWTLGRTDGALNQTIFRSPTVFNFFDPNYSEPGAVQAAGLVSPELDIIFETTITNAQNLIYTGVYSQYNADGSPKLTGPGWKGDSYGSDIYLNLSTAGAGLLALDTSSGPSAMLTQVVLLLSGGPLDSSGAAQARIQSFLDASLPGTANQLARVEAAIQLTATASQTAAEK